MLGGDAENSSGPFFGEFSQIFFPPQPFSGVKKKIHIPIHKNRLNHNLIALNAPDTFLDFKKIYYGIFFYFKH